MKLRDTVEVLTYPTTRDRGRDVPDYSQTPTAVAVPVFSVQPGPSTELVAQRSDATAVRWTVWAPPGSPFTDDSIVRYGGRVYQVDGEPQAWRSISGRLDHMVVALVSWEA